MAHEFHQVYTCIYVPCVSAKRCKRLSDLFLYRLLTEMTSCRPREQSMEAGVLRKDHQSSDDSSGAEHTQDTRALEVSFAGVGTCR